MASVTQLGYLGLNVSNLAEWERFATEILGLQIVDKGSDGFLMRMDENHYRFIVQQDGADDVAFLGWEVADQRSLQELASQLKAGGVEVAPGSPQDASVRGVAELVRFADPNGISCEAYYGPLMNFEKPFNSPRAISGFVTDTMGLGHIVIRADDSAKTLKFYRDLLGMRISDFVDVKMRNNPEMRLGLTFLHCNPRHHTLAFGEIPARKRLMHFMLQAKSIDDVGSTLYLAQDRGIPISGSLGRHTNDHMVSFYMRSPSGFEVEYGFGARTVDDETWKVQRHEAGSIWGHRGMLPQPKPSA
jgi:biphenyl-2,3-diol 1,2-dioxygenase